MEALEAVSRIWPIFVTIILFVAWLIRIEVNQSFLDKQLAAYKLENEKAKKEVDKQFESIKQEASVRNESNQQKFDDIHDMFMGIKEQLARIEGRILQSHNN